MRDRLTWVSSRDATASKKYNICICLFSHECQCAVKCWIFSKQIIRFYTEHYCPGHFSRRTGIRIIQGLSRKIFQFNPFHDKEWNLFYPYNFPFSVKLNPIKKRIGGNLNPFWWILSLLIGKCFQFNKMLCWLLAFILFSNY